MLTEQQLHEKLKKHLEYTTYWMGRFQATDTTDSRRDATYSLGKLAAYFDIQRELFPNLKVEHSPPTGTGLV